MLPDPRALPRRGLGPLRRPGGRRPGRSLTAELANPAFRRLWLAQVVSEVGDWAARLALTVIVYDRTHAALWSAMVTVCALLPMLGPGQLLASFGDRLDRRVVLVSADILRAVIFGVLAIAPHLPVPVLLAASVLAGLASAPFEAARGAATCDVVPEERLPSALALGQATQSLALLLGWALGGALVAVMSARGTLGVNAFSFVVSAALLTGLPASNPAAGGAWGPGGELATLSAVGRLRAAARFLASDPLIRQAGAVAVLGVGPVTALNSLVVPYVTRRWGEHPGGSALILIAGSAVELGVTLAVTRSRPPHELVRVAAICAAIPAFVSCCLLLSGVAAGQAVGLAVASGSAAALAPAAAAVGPRLPMALRASCYTVLGTALTLTQALMTEIGGWLADLVSPVYAGAVVAVVPLLAGGFVLVSARRLAAHDDQPAGAAAELVTAGAT